MIIVLDSGTTSCRTLAFDKTGVIRAMAQQEFTQYFPEPGYVEHDADEIARVQRATLTDVLAQVGVKNVAAMGITNQRETVVLWERATGRPVCPAIVWQCRRTTQDCHERKLAGQEPFVHIRTGLLLDPYFSATKIAWALDNIPGLRIRAERGEICFGTVDSWLLWQLSGGKVHATDASNASRTLLYNLHTGDWDSELLALFNIPVAMLPQIRPSFGQIATVTIEGKTIPVTAILGDQQAALLGQGCIHPGMAKSTYGTGCFLLRNIGDDLPTLTENSRGILTTVAWQDSNGKRTYAREGAVFMGGAVVQWLRDGLGLISHAEETEALAASVPDTGGVYFVPAFTGLGTPHWNPEARGMICGLTRGTTKAHLVRAALEAICYQTRDILDAMPQTSPQTNNSTIPLKVDGGATRNDFLLQFQANILGVPVERAAHTETTAFGAALAAGVACGFWQSWEEAIALCHTEKQFTPTMSESERVKLLAGWQHAVQYQL
jgi:glycerol kinase